MADPTFRSNTTSESRRTGEHPTYSGQQISTGKKVLWGMGGVTDCLVMNGLNGLIDQVYMIGMGLDPKWIGLARSVPRFLDIITDPLIGHLSDNTRSRWGRRKPWMLAGVLVIAAAGIAMWYPPVSMGPTAVNLFVMAMLALLFTVGYACFTIPYTAMGFEMSTSSDERTHLFKYRLLAFTAIGFLTPWLARICMEIEGDKAEVWKGVQGVRWVSLGIAALIVITGLLPIVFCKDVVHAPNEKKVPFAEAVKHTMKNRSFWPIISGNFLMKFGTSVTGIFFYYLFLYRLGGGMKAGATEWGWFVTVTTVATLAGTPLVAWAAQRIGKKQTVIALMALSACAFVSVKWTFQPQLAAARLYLFTGTAIGLFCNTMPMIINSMLADVCDADEIRSGHRREAFYGAVFVTCDKIAVAVTLFLQGFLLQASGFNAKLDVQTAATLDTWMNWLLLTQPTGFVVGMLCLFAYPLTKARLQEIRAELDARHAR
jgi:GPH family glycoside/pentoside/hexuronide:cation symporter